MLEINFSRQIFIMKNQRNEEKVRKSGENLETLIWI